MSCLNMRLLPTRKMWKFISTKLQTKFLKLFNRSKITKKSKNDPNRFNKTSKKLAPLPIYRVQFKTKRSNKFKHKSRPTIKYHKRPAPVYIDQLFIQNIKEDYVQPMVIANTENKDHKQTCVKETELARIREGESSISSTSMIVGHENSHDHKQVGADEMWESLTLASPQYLHGINERAEEFITRFRADMQRQENLLSHRL